VFDPFFTTKEVGAGSGLGLSMVQGFVRQSSGSVAIESVVGQGTAVTLYLPRTLEAATVATRAVAAPVTGDGLVLLVDDDEAVRSVTAELLELTGYAVLPAANGADAIACFEREGARIDILVTDLVLADGMDGVDLATALQNRRPDLPVLLVTGYSDALLDTVRIRAMPVLAKPFDHATLAQAVQAAMWAGVNGRRPAFGG
jgi:CheY-like chemotaxis protein